MNMKLALTILATALVAPAAFGIPDQINYQGYLTRPDGTPLDTTVAMTFSLWNSDGSILRWSETQPSVNVTNGLFAVLLGQYNPISETVLGYQGLHLGITVGSDSEMSPHVPLASAAYARRVETVSGASGGAIMGDVWITGKAKIGSENDNGGDRAFVAGYQNTATGAYTTIPGGWHNTASGNRSVVG